MCKSFLTPAALLLLLLAGCSTTTAPKPAEKAPEPVTGLHALAQMFSAARGWAPDVLVYRVTSVNAGAVKPLPGKAAAWQATFISPTLGQSRTYTYSVVDVSTSIREGIFPDPPSPFSARGQSAQPFSVAAAKKDTDEVFETALKYGKDYNAQNPGMAINYLLELNNRWPSAAWRVIWGASPSTSSFSVMVDASTGKFVEVIH